MWLLPGCHTRREWISSLCLLLEVQHLAKDPSHTMIVQLWEALPRHLTFSSNRICFWAQALPLVSARVTLQGCCVYPHTALTLADLATCVFPGPASWPELVWQTQVPHSPLSLSQPHTGILIWIWAVLHGLLPLPPLWCQQWFSFPEGRTACPYCFLAYV